MTLATIKDHITDKLREILRGADKFKSCEKYRELVDLIHKTISKVYLCETAGELEDIDEPLGEIERVWNACLRAISPDSLPETLFDFNFVLSDDDNDNDDEEETCVSNAPTASADPDNDLPLEKSQIDTDDDDEDDPDPESETEPLDIDDQIKEVEEFYRLHAVDGGASCRSLIKSIRKESLGRLQAAQTETELSDAVLANRKAFKKYLKKLDKYEKIKNAKPEYDKVHPAESAVKPNILRFCVGLTTALSGVGIGIIEAFVNSNSIWDWREFVWAIIGFGASYLLLSLIYAIAISSSVSVAAIRRLSFARLIMAAITAVGCIVFWIVTADDELFLISLAATIPFTFFGICVYLNYRLGLFKVMKKKPTKKSQKSEKNTDSSEK